MHLKTNKSLALQKYPIGYDISVFYGIAINLYQDFFHETVPLIINQFFFQKNDYDYEIVILISRHFDYDFVINIHGLCALILF